MPNPGKVENIIQLVETQKIRPECVCVPSSASSFVSRSRRFTFHLSHNDQHWATPSISLLNHISTQKPLHRLASWDSKTWSIQLLIKVWYCEIEIQIIFRIEFRRTSTSKCPLSLCGNLLTLLMPFFSSTVVSVMRWSMLVSAKYPDIGILCCPLWQSKPYAWTRSFDTLANVGRCCHICLIEVIVLRLYEEIWWIWRYKWCCFRYPIHSTSIRFHSEESLALRITRFAIQNRCGRWWKWKTVSSYHEEEGLSSSWR